MTLTIIT